MSEDKNVKKKEKNQDGGKKEINIIYLLKETDKIRL